MSEAARIQAYFRESARRLYESLPLPPFTIFLHPADRLVYRNYAIPDEPAAGDLSEPLAQLEEAFRARDRVPRLEYVEGFAPALAPELERAGFARELGSPVMACGPAALRRPPAVPGLEMTRLDDGGPLEDVRAALTIQRRAFGTGEEPVATRAEAADYARRLAEDAMLLARLDGQAVGVATAVAPRDGLSEVAGVAVVAHARGRGIGSALTVAATEAAFAAGAELAVLTPGGEEAMRVYARAGYEPVETMLHYLLAERRAQRAPARRLLP